MMKYLLHILFFALIFACSNTEKSVSVKESATSEMEPAMDSTSEQVATEEMVKDTLQYINGAAFFNTSYCNGARPSNEILEQHRRERNLVNSTIKLKNVKTGKEIEVKTDAKGAFKIPLESESEFEYYLTKQSDPSLGFINIKCDAVFERKYGTFKMSDISDSLHLLFHLTCDPCDPYSRMRP